MKKIKPKKCAVCGGEFVPYLTTQKVCGVTCAISSAKKETVKKEAREWSEEKKVRKEKLKRQSDWLQDLQKVFNAYIRLSQKGSKCISCENPNPSDAGHYRSVGAHPELRFEEKNVNLQCRKCNGYWGGNLIEYRKGLIRKYGVKIVERLEGPHEAVKLSIPEIKAKIAYYKHKIKVIKKGIDVGKDYDGV